MNDSFVLGRHLSAAEKRFAPLRGRSKYNGHSCSRVTSATRYFKRSGKDSGSAVIVVGVLLETSAHPQLRRLALGVGLFSFFFAPTANTARLFVEQQYATTRDGSSGSSEHYDESGTP